MRPARCRKGPDHDYDHDHDYVEDMAIPKNLIHLLEYLRLAWPGGRTVGDLARQLDIQPWRVVELVGRCEHLAIPLDQAGPSLRLDPATLPLIGELIECGLGTRRIGRSVIVFGQAASTNDIAWQAARRRGSRGLTSSDGLVVLAETQSAGRGRLGRSWLDQPARSLLFSLLLLDVPRTEGLANQLVMAASVAVAEAIRQTVDLSAAIRWPNDLYLSGRKVAGILLESRPAGGPLSPGQPLPPRGGSIGSVDVVLGVGVNCNSDIGRFPEVLRRTATSLSAEFEREGSAGSGSAGSGVDRTALMRAVLRRLEHWLVGPPIATPSPGGEGQPRERGSSRDGGPLTEADSPDALHRAYLAWMDQQALRVRIHHDRTTLEATIRDVDPIAGLIVELPTGGVRHFSPSQISVEWLAPAE